MYEWIVHRYQYETRLKVWNPTKSCLSPAERDDQIPKVWVATDNSSLCTGDLLREHT